MHYLKKHTIVVLCLFLGSISQSMGQKENKSIKGFVFELGTNNPISDCNIIIHAERQETAITQVDGSFVFKTKLENMEKVKITFNHINYYSKDIEIILGENIEVFLKNKLYTIDDVVIHSAYSNNNKGNKFVYTPLQAESSISIIGEPDVVRHISSLPGVSQGIEGTLGLFVRGSNNGSNRIEFNDVPFYSYSHLLGMFSAFSPDIIEKATFRPGGIPAQSGNLSSSLLRITPKKQIISDLNGKISLSPYMTGAYLSFPLKKEKLSLQLATRTSFLPSLINQAMNLLADGEDEEFQEIKGQILDVTSIINWKINNANCADFMFYTSNDYFNFKDNHNEDKMNWSSLAFKIGLETRISSKLNLNSFAYYSSTYSTQEQVYFDDYTSKKIASQLRLGSKLKEWSFNSRLQYILNDKFSLTGGFNYQLQEFNPASERSIYIQDVDNEYNNIESSGLLAGFTDINYSNYEKIELTLGYRYTFQHIEGQSRNNYDIRFLSDIYLSKKMGIELSYDKFTQFYHVLEGLPTGWSLNIMIPSSSSFPEEVTNQVYGGIFVKDQFKNMRVHLTLGAYYRDMQNLVSYKNTVNIFGIEDVSWKDEIDVGTGSSYGLELAGSVQSERISTTLAYTLSKTDRNFSQINGGNSYPFKFDRKHILNLQSKYTILKNTNKKGHQREQIANAVIAYSSGHNTTLPIASYQGVLPPYWNERENGWDFPQEVDDNAYHRQEMTSRNDFKMKDYFRIDLAYTFIKHRPKSTRELSFSIFNVLNKKNPHLVFYEDDKWQQLSIVPIMPSIRWSKSF